MTRALVIAPQWIGDAVMSEPLLRALAVRGESITVAALPQIAPVYRAMRFGGTEGAIEETAPVCRAMGLAGVDVIELQVPRRGLQIAARRALAASWRGRFDVAYVLPNAWKSALAPWFAGIPRRVGYLGEMRFGLLNRRLGNPNPMPPMVAFYAALATVDRSPSPAAATDAKALAPRLVVDDEAIAAALATQGLVRGGYRVFAPGAEYGPAKRWPAARYAELAVRLAGDGLATLLLGSAKDAGVCDEIVRAVSTAHSTSATAVADVRNLAGRTRLEDAIALIAGAARMVSNDSGLMHVAAALGVPQVAIFGSSSPRHTPPLSARARVVWLKDDAAYTPPLDCSPCFERTCPLGHTRCLVDVSASRVVGQLLLNR